MNETIVPISKATATPSISVWRERWQWPTFLLGVLAVVVTLVLRPVLPQNREALLRERLREALTQIVAGETATLDELDQAESFPSLTGAFHLVQAASWLANLDELPADKQASRLAEARRHLDAATHRGVPESLQARLAYQQAKAQWYATPTLTALEFFAAAVEKSPADAIEGLRVLAAGNEQMQDPEAALAALESLLVQPRLRDPNPVRLQCGRLLLQLERWPESRMTLERIPAKAPEHVAALDLRARVYYQEENWSKAAECWTEYLQKAPTAAARVQYHLGLCAWERHQLTAARTAWATVVQQHPDSPEALPARLYLAEAALRDGAVDQALQEYGAVLASIPAERLGPYVTPEELHKNVDRTWQTLLSQGHHHAALQLARSYVRLAPPEVAARMVAVSAKARARQILENASAEPATLVEARQTLVAAGMACIDVAGGVMEATDRADWYWQGADAFLQAQEYARALLVLEEYFTIGASPSSEAAARVGLGEACQALKQTDRAQTILVEASMGQGPLQARAKYLLALTVLDRQNYAAAEQLLRDVLSESGTEGVEDRKLALAALVHVLFRREAYVDATHYLQRGLNEAPENVQTRYWLAEAHRRAARQQRQVVTQADTTAARDFYQRTYREHLEAAYSHFQALATRLDNPVGQELLTLQRESRFGMAEAALHLDRLDEALGLYRRLLEQYAGTPPELQAHVQLVQVHVRRRSMDEGSQALAQARQLLARLSDQELASLRLSRRDWETWIASLERTVQAGSVPVPPARP